MFMNLHTLPVGQHMYTVAITDQPADADDIFYDEVDVVAPARATIQEVLLAADLSGYGGQRVIGVVDQSDPYVLMQDTASEIVVLAR